MTGRAADRDGTGADERWDALRQLEDWLQTPMLVLGFAWLLLVLAELVWGAARIPEIFGTAIWVMFLAEFALRLALAPDKARFLRGNWLTVLALAVPALRLLRPLRFLRLARAARGLRLVRIVGAANRGMNALRAAMRRRGLGYAVALTALVTLLGAGGMLAFEPASEVEGGFAGFADALWWTAMIMTTMGSAYWPQTGEGRLLCLLLSFYAFAVFGYITASFASFFVGRDREERAAGAIRRRRCSGQRSQPCGRSYEASSAAIRHERATGYPRARPLRSAPWRRSSPEAAEPRPGARVARPGGWPRPVHGREADHVLR